MGLPGRCHVGHSQDEEARLRQAWAYARAAHRYALWALGSSAVEILLAALALLTR